MRTIAGILVLVGGWFISILVFGKMKEVEDNQEANRAYSILFIIVLIAAHFLAYKIAGIHLGD